tara:strand:- start:34143 stop:34271 length:129 start_codon:yes stop_codon:yes gene_type:complete
MSKFWEDIAEYVTELIQKQPQKEEHKTLIEKLKSFINNDKDS